MGNSFDSSKFMFFSLQINFNDDIRDTVFDQKYPLKPSFFLLFFHKSQMFVCTQIKVLKLETTGILLAFYFAFISITFRSF